MKKAIIAMSLMVRLTAVEPQVQPKKLSPAKRLQLRRKERMLDKGRREYG